MKRVTWVALGGIVALTCVAETDLAKASAEEAMRPVLPGWGRYYWNQRSIWYIHPAEAGDAFLRLHAVTKDAKYLAAARRIGDTYLRLQGKDGTWYLKMWERDGKPVNPNRLLPLGVCDFLVALERATGDRRYGAAADRAFTFIEKGPLADWNWEGQFEDVEPTARYENLTKHPACETALYLLRRYRGDARRLLQARELLRFAEDQFVAWERPCRADGTAVESPFLKGKRIAEWPVFPAVMEQYKWYVPIDASAAKLIRTYLALYAVAHDPLDLAKARALGDSCTRIQEPTGCITTHWTSGSQKPVSPGKIRQADWLNCMIATAEALEELSQTEKED